MPVSGRCRGDREAVAEGSVSTGRADQWVSGPVPTSCASITEQRLTSHPVCLSSLSSLELAGEYDKAKDAQDKATANSTENMQNKREIAKEFKAYKEHKSEATKLTKLRKDKDDLVVGQVLWRLFHIQDGINTASDDIKQKNKELAKLRKEHDSHEKKVASARKQQVALQADISKQEKVIKTKEKAADTLAPKLVAVEAQISHSEKKAASAESLAEKVERDVSRQTESLDSLRADLRKVEKLAKDAEGQSPPSALACGLTSLTSPSLPVSIFPAAQKKSAQQAGKSLSEADIAEYRKLLVRAPSEFIRTSPVD